MHLPLKLARSAFLSRIVNICESLTLFRDFYIVPIVAKNLKLAMCGIKRKTITDIISTAEVSNDTENFIVSRTT